MALGNTRFSHLGRKAGILFLCGAAFSGVMACRKSSGEAVPPPPTAPSVNSAGEADRLYAQRSDLMKVRQGLIGLRQALAGNPTDYEIVWRLAKFNYFLGMHTTDEAEKEKAFRDGIEAGKLAVKLNDGKPEGHFWLGANYGGNAEISTLAGLTDIEDIKHEMEAVLKLDEGFEGGSAYMALGQVYLKAPRIFGGDVDKAISYLERGLKFGENNGLLHLRLAQAYAEAHRTEDARRQLQILFEKGPKPGYEPEYNDAVKEGRELEEKLKQ